MPLPVGVTTCNLTFGSGLTFAGDNVSVSLTLVPTHSVVWAATGQALVDFPLTVSVAAGVPGSLAVPVVDQDGWIGVDGAAFTMWAYTATLTWRFGNETRAQVKAVQPLTGQATVDLDLVPGGTVTVPVSAPIPAVLSVNGETGAVEIATGGVETWSQVVATPDFPVSGVVLGNDSRLTDQRTPTDGSVTNAKVASGAGISMDKTADSASRVAMSPSERTKLAGITPAATANSPDADLRDRSTHTGTQAQSTITNLTTDLAAKAPLASPTFTGTVSGVTKTHVGLANVDDTRQMPLSGQRFRIAASDANTWPTKASSIPSGFTGPIEWDHSDYGTVTTLPADLVAGDWVVDLAP